MAWKERRRLPACALLLCTVLLLCAGRSCERARLQPEGMRITLTLYDAGGRQLAGASYTSACRERQEYRGTLPISGGAVDYVLAVGPAD